MEQEIDLMEYWRIIRKRRLIIIIIPLIALITSAILSFFVIHPVYQASATVIVGKRMEGQADKIVEYNSVMANQQLAKTYETIAKSRTVLSRVAEQVGRSADDLAQEVAIEAVKSTEVIAIKVNDQNPERAAVVANKITEEFSKRVLEIKKVDSVGIVDPAVAPDKPIKPNKKMNMILAFVIGLFSAVGLAFLLEFIDNTIKSPDEVEELTGLAVIGTVPKFTILNSQVK